MFFRPIGFGYHQPPLAPHFSAKGKKDDDELDALLRKAFEKAEAGDQEAKAVLDKIFGAFQENVTQEVLRLPEAAQDEFIKDPTLENLDNLNREADELGKTSFLPGKYRRPPEA